MSNKMLGPRGTTRNHTLQDDMESLIYVVLYCALLYLPHNLSDQELAQKIWLLFEDAELMDGCLVGGVGKLDNTGSQIHTKSVEFNTPFKEWLNSMMKFCRPPRHMSPGTEDPWTEVHLLDKFWADFLEKHTLKTNDCQPHEHPHVTDRYEVHGEVSRVSSEAILLRKRTAEERSLDHPLSKKPCLPAADSTPTRPVRRSKRLLAQQERSQPRRGTQSNARAPARTKVPTHGRSARRRPQVVVTG